MSIMKWRLFYAVKFGVVFTTWNNMICTDIKLCAECSDRTEKAVGDSTEEMGVIIQGDLE